MLLSREVSDVPEDDFLGINREPLGSTLASPFKEAISYRDQRLLN